MTALDRYALDALLLALPEQTAGHSVMPLFDEPFCFLCPTEHRLSNQPEVTEQELATERLLLLDDGHCLRDQALVVCGEQAGELQLRGDDFRATSLETICEMVAAGLGCTLLPALAVPFLTSRHQGLQVRPLRAAKAFRRVGLLWRASYPRGQDVNVLGAFIQAHLPGGVVRLRRGRQPVLPLPLREGARGRGRDKGPSY